MDRIPFRANNLLVDRFDYDFTCFSTANHIQLESGEIIGTQGGDDVVVSHWDNELSIVDYLSFGSAYNDEAHFILENNGDIIIGATFWDELSLADSIYRAHRPGKSIFLAQFSSSFELRSKVILSSSNTVRCGEGIVLSNGHILTSGWFVDDLYIEDTAIVENDQGVFLIEWDVNFNPIQIRIWSGSGRIEVVQLIANSQNPYAAIRFEDSLFVEERAFVTRRAFIANTVLVKLSPSLHAQQSILIKSTFDNQVVTDKALENQPLRLAINFRGNLEIGGEKIEGLPMTDQSALVEFNEELDVSELSYAPSKTGARFSNIMTSGDLLSSGIGVFDAWQSSPPQPNAWIAMSPLDPRPQFLGLVGEEIIIDRLFSSDSTVYISGLFRGKIELPDQNISLTEEDYEAFMLSFSSTSTNSPEPSELLLFPNPVQRSFQVHPAGEEDWVRIWNMTGQLVYNKKYRKGVEIPLLNPGVYIIELESVEMRRTARFVKVDRIE